MKKNATEVVQANTEPVDCDEDGSANDDYDDEKLEDNDLGDDVDDDDLDEDDQEEIEEELEEDPDSDASGNVTRVSLRGVGTLASRGELPDEIFCLLLLLFLF